MFTIVLQCETEEQLEALMAVLPEGVTVVPSEAPEAEVEAEPVTETEVQEDIPA
jgi:hypothetical protein